MDRRVGNTKKMGALFGILAAIGGPIPEPETIPYAFFILSRRFSAIFQGEHVPPYTCMPSYGLSMQKDVLGVDIAIMWLKIPSLH